MMAQTGTDEPGKSKVRLEVKVVGCPSSEFLKRAYQMLAKRLIEELESECALQST
ncbi:MAG: hypothetical protein ACPLPR_10370 [Bacillota bacterium]